MSKTAMKIFAFTWLALQSIFGTGPEHVVAIVLLVIIGIFCIAIIYSELKHDQ